MSLQIMIFSYTKNQFCFCDKAHPLIDVAGINWLMTHENEYSHNIFPFFSSLNLMKNILKDVFLPLI